MTKKGGHEGRLKPETASFNKNPTKAGGYLSSKTKKNCDCNFYLIFSLICYRSLFFNGVAEKLNVFERGGVVPINNDRHLFT